MRDIDDMQKASPTHVQGISRGYYPPPQRLVVAHGHPQGCERWGSHVCCDQEHPETRDGWIQYPYRWQRGHPKDEGGNVEASASYWEPSRRRNCEPTR